MAGMTLMPLLLLVLVLAPIMPLVALRAHTGRVGLQLQRMRVGQVPSGQHQVCPAGRARNCAACMPACCTCSCGRPLVLLRCCRPS